MTGIKHDNGKPRYDLLHPDMLEPVVKALTHGAEKYAEEEGAENWRGRSDTRHYAAAMRHLMAYRRGELVDEESGCPHVACAAVNLLFILGNGPFRPMQSEVGMHIRKMRGAQPQHTEAPKLEAGMQFLVTQAAVDEHVETHPGICNAKVRARFVGQTRTLRKADVVNKDFWFMEDDSFVWDPEILARHQPPTSLPKFLPMPTTFEKGMRFYVPENAQELFEEDGRPSWIRSMDLFLGRVVTLKKLSGWREYWTLSEDQTKCHWDPRLLSYVGGPL